MEACNNPEILRVIMFILQILKVVFIIVPIGLILMIGLDLFKNITAGKEDEMKKNVSIAIKRIIFCVCIFFVPTIVNLVNSIVNEVLEDTTINYTVCFKNATASNIENLIETNAKQAVENAKTKRTMQAVLDAETAVEKLNEGQLKNDLTAELKTIKEEVKQEINNKIEEEEQTNPVKPGNSTNKQFLYEIEHPNTRYKGHTVDLTDSQYLKVLRSIFGEQEQGSYEIYVGLSQYIRDYIDYGTINRTYDNLGSFWLKRGGSLSSTYNLEWFKKNRPELIKAVDYVFKQGGSLAQRQLCFYVDDDDVAYNGGSYQAAHNRLIEASCGGGHEHDKIRLSPEENPSNWSEFNFGIKQDSNAETR